MALLFPYPEGAQPLSYSHTAGTQNHAESPLYIEYGVMIVTQCSLTWTTNQQSMAWTPVLIKAEV